MLIEICRTVLCTCTFFLSALVVYGIILVIGLDHWSESAFVLRLIEQGVVKLKILQEKTELLKRVVISRRFFRSIKKPTTFFYLLYESDYKKCSKQLSNKKVDKSFMLL